VESAVLQSCRRISSKVTLSPSNKTKLALALALIGFALKSVLCRMALGGHAIDAWSFTAVRLCGGAVMLAFVARTFSRAPAEPSGASLTSAVALFVYAAAFSLAYLRLSAGVGALVLFAAVQVAMIGWGALRGERLGAREWMGLVLAFAGLSVLALRGDAVADPIGLASMALAGIAWGAYSIRGRKSRSPLRTTAGNFAWSVPLALAGLFVGRNGLQATTGGIALALASGALASGLGYSLWYLALHSLPAKTAALVQLIVPVLAAAAGVAFLGEHVTPRLVVAGSLILGGVALAILRRAPSMGPAAAKP
jgi:drug/metabolite transporter (DMT)-like permease